MLSNAKSRTAGKTKTTIITALLLLAMVSGAVAQEKWEYAVVSYSPTYQNIAISMGGQKYYVIETKENSKIKERNFNAVLNEVDKLQGEGWELFNTAATGMNTDVVYDVNYPNYLFYMRKKKL